MKLNNEQRKMVEENHNLIYSYCKYKGLNIDEYYGDLAIVLCDVVKKYEKQKSKISTYAYKAFDIKILNMYRNMTKRGKYKPTILLSDLLESPIKMKFYDNIYSDINYNTMVNILNNSEVGNLLLQGYNQKEIIKKLNKSKFLVSKEIERLRKQIEAEILI